MKQKLLLSATLLFFTSCLFAQQYKRWERHQIARFYEKVEIRLDMHSLDKEGEEIYDSYLVFYSPIELEDGVYEIEMGDRVNSKLWRIEGTDIYILFRHNPFLIWGDDGVLEVYYSNAFFYERKP